MVHADSHSADNSQEQHAHGILPVRVYLIVYALLMLFLGLTYGAAKLDMGPFNLPVALAIAIVKTALVVLFFMHVKYGTRLTWIWAALGFIWMLLLFGTLGDYITREWIRVPGW